MNAADHYGLDDLRTAAFDHAHTCVALDNVCPLLATAERYIHYKSTKMFMQKVRAHIMYGGVHSRLQLLEYVDTHADSILVLADFVHLSLRVVELIMCRQTLHVAELQKWRALQRWATHAARTSKGDFCSYDL
jgi:hypothetical protein